VLYPSRGVSSVSAGWLGQINREPAELRRRWLRHVVEKRDRLVGSAASSSRAQYGKNRLSLALRPGVPLANFTILNKPRTKGKRFFAIFWIFLGGRIWKKLLPRAGLRLVLVITIITLFLGKERGSSRTLLFSGS
jgi:hypothetical protein